MNDDKYYIPDLEDFRIGYEFEMDDTWGGWKKMILTQELLKNPLVPLGSGNERIPWYWKIRTPFLTKEQIEDEGWKQLTEIKFEKPSRLKDCIYYLWFFREHSFKSIIEFNYINELAEIKILQTLYTGPIKSINELRYISKLLNI
jgi:hypothetical protein